MLTDIPKAQRYFLNPLKTDDPNEERMTSEKHIIEVGGAGIMNEIGFYIEDKEVALVMGISEDRCLLFVDKTDVECIDILNKAKVSYDEKIGKAIGDKKDDQVAEQSV